MSKKVIALTITLLLSTPLCADTGAGITEEALAKAASIVAEDTSQSLPAMLEVAQAVPAAVSSDSFTEVIQDTMDQAKEILPTSVPTEIKEAMESVPASISAEGLTKTTEVAAEAIPSEIIANSATAITEEAAKTSTNVIKEGTDNLDPEITKTTLDSFKDFGRNIKTKINSGFKTTREFTSTHKNELLIAAGTIAAAYVSYRLIKWAVAKKKQNKNK